jgi:hypothetical protein
MQTPKKTPPSSPLDPAESAGAHTGIPWRVVGDGTISESKKLKLSPIPSSWTKKANRRKVAQTALLNARPYA